MRPLIGICTNYTTNDQVGIITGLGLPGQDWQLLAGDYIRAIERAGGCPLIIPITESPETLEPLLNQLDGILFTGGSDLDPALYGELPRYGLGNINPQRDKHEIALCRRLLYDAQLPILGVCRGLQLLNVTAGGTLYQDLREDGACEFRHDLYIYPKEHPSHRVNVTPGSRLWEMFKQDVIVTNGFNHQAVSKVAPEFKVTMTAEDGVVEGMEMDGTRFVAALQWHPEMMIDKYPEYLAPYVVFVEECTRYHNKRNGGILDG